MLWQGAVLLLLFFLLSCLYYVVLGEEGSESEGKDWCWLCEGRARAVCVCVTPHIWWIVWESLWTICQICTSQGVADVNLGGSSVWVFGWAS